MVNATKEMFSKYAEFSGRTSRANFWWAILGYYLLTFAIGFGIGIVCGLAGIDSDKVSKVITPIWMLATFLPVIAMEVRRLHDINKPGTWVLITFLPIVGPFILLAFLCSPAVDEGNTY